jgi:hypothetical protein
MQIWQKFFLFQNKLDSALFYNQLSKRYTANDDAFGVSRNLLNYAAIYTKRNDNDWAETYFKKTIIYSDSTKVWVNLICGLLEYSKYFFSKNTLDSSFKYAQLSWEKHKQNIGTTGVLSIDITDELQKILQKLGSMTVHIFILS